MRIQDWRPPGWLVLVLIAESAAFVGSGIADLAADRGDPALSALLPITIGIVNAIAVLALSKERAAVRRGTVQEARKPWEVVSVVVAQASAVPLLFVPLWAEWNSGVHDLWDIVICLAAAGLLVVAVSLLVLAVSARPDASLNKTWVVFLTLLPLASSVQFWYTTFYKPAHQRPNVNVTAILEDAGSKDGVSRIRATVTLVNKGSIDLDFFDAIYTVTGHGIEPSSARLTDKEFGVALKPGKVTSNDPGAPYNGVLQTGRLIRPGGHLVPGQEHVSSFVFDVENAAQEKVRLTVHLSAIVAGGSGLDSPVPCTSGLSDPSTCLQSSVPTEGWLRTVLSDHPVARTMAVYPAEATPYLRTEFQLADTEDLDSEDFRVSQQVQDLYPYLNSRGFTTSVEHGLAP